MSDDAVTVAYVHDGSEVAYSWHASLLKLMMWDSHHHKRVVRGGFSTIRAASDGVTQARNRVVRDWLAGSDSPWLWWIDTDMGFAPDTVDRLLDAADPVDRPVVGGLCFAQRDDNPDGWGGYRPSIWPVLMDWSEQRGNTGFLPRHDYPLDTLTRAVGTGSACILIHRSVFERMREKHDPSWSRWYSRLPAPSENGEDLAEDLSFCLRMRELEIPLHVHTGVKTTHMKRVWLNEDQYQQGLAAALAAEPALPVPVHPELAVAVDVPASLKTLHDNEHVSDGMLKLPADLDRYKAIIDATRPEVIVETGTRTGASAQWFAAQGLAVITVDVQPRDGMATFGKHQQGFLGEVHYLIGDAADPDMAAKVAELVGGRRCMVSLDSDHSAAHVAKEIALYGPLVTAGCYLVVEDGIFGYAPQELREAHIPGQDGSPLDAIAEHLHGNPNWSRDLAVERLSPVSHHPCGYWIKVA